MGKKMMILKACGAHGEKHECDGIKNQAELYGITVVEHCPKNNEEVSKALKDGNKYDYIYLSSHGNDEGFSSEDGKVDFIWSDFSKELCEAMCMEDDCVIMLSCCRGGLNQVAYELIWHCGKIDYIVGPRQSLVPSEMLISFNILLYNMEKRHVDPIIASEKVKAATDIRFICFDRMETEADASYLLWKERKDADWSAYLEKQAEVERETAANN